MMLIKYTKLYDPGAYGLVSILPKSSAQTEGAIPQYIPSIDRHIKMSKLLGLGRYIEALVHHDLFF
jgi:hypothetical protein